MGLPTLSNSVCCESVWSTTWSNAYGVALPLLAFTSTVLPSLALSSARWKPSACSRALGGRTRTNT